MSTISAGTTSTNALVNTGDTTGNLVFQTNGTTTAMTIDTSQRVGIGTSSPAEALEISRAAPVIRLSSTAAAGSASTYAVLNATSGNSGNFFRAFIATSDSGATYDWGIGNFGTTTKDVLAFYSGGLTERMRIDSSGNVGIGTTTPNAAAGYTNVTVNNTAGGIYDINVAGTLVSRWYANSTAAYIGSNTSIPFVFNVAAAERARIDSNGNLLVGTTTNNGRISSLASGSGTAGYFASSGSTITLVVADSGVNGAGIALYGNGATTPNKYIRAQAGSLQFINNAYSQVIALFADAGVYNTAVGGTNRVMYVDNTNTLGYLSSVRASKTNIAPMPATDWLLQLQPKTFNYRKKDKDGKYTDEVDGGIQYGLIAEEVEQVKPDLCFYDEVDGKQELRGIHYEKLVVPMLKAIQEQQAMITQLQAEVVALKGTAQ